MAFDQGGEGRLAGFTLTAQDTHEQAPRRTNRSSIRHGTERGTIGCRMLPCARPVIDDIPPEDPTAPTTRVRLAPHDLHASTENFNPRFFGLFPFWRRTGPNPEYGSCSPVSV